MSQAIVPPSAVPFSAPAITAGGINGLGSLRFVGTTNGGAPTSGTYQTGDVVLDLSNLVVWVCQSGGTPGTWVGMSYLRTDANAPNPQTVNTQLNVGKQIYSNGGYIQANDPSGSNGASFASVLSNGQYQAAFGIHPGGNGTLYISHYDGSTWHEIDFSGGNMNIPGNMTVAGTINGANLYKFSWKTSASATIPANSSATVAAFSGIPSGANMGFVLFTINSVSSAYSTYSTPTIYLFANSTQAPIGNASIFHNGYQFQFMIFYSSGSIVVTLSSNMNSSYSFSGSFTLSGVVF